MSPSICATADYQRLLRLVANKRMLLCATVRPASVTAIVLVFPKSGRDTLLFKKGGLVRWLLANSAAAFSSQRVCVLLCLRAKLWSTLTGLFGKTSVYAGPPVLHFTILAAASKCASRSCPRATRRRKGRGNAWLTHPFGTVSV